MRARRLSAAGPATDEGVRQFNDDWPLNSWQVTENSNGYQVQYIRLLTSVMSPESRPER